MHKRATVGGYFSLLLLAFLLTVQPLSVQPVKSAENEQVKEYLLLLTPTRENFLKTITDEERQTIHEHFVYLKSLLDTGKLKLAGRCLDGTLVVAIVRCDSLSEAQELIDKDPAVTAKMFKGVLKSWSTSLLAEQW